MSDHPCKQTITVLASGRIVDVPPLGACTIRELESAFPGLDAAEDNVGMFGRNGSRVSWRAVREGVAGDQLRVWHDGDDVLVIELERPDADGGWAELREQLGAPSQKFDVLARVQQGLWLYSTRGVAAQFSRPASAGVGDERLDRVMVFPPTTRDDFIAHLAMSLVPPRDHARS